MRLLILGGSWFVGRALVGAALLRGHDVTVFNRGRSGHLPRERVRVVHGDRESRGDLDRLASLGPWDVVIDVPGGVPAVVRDSARALAGVVDRCVFMSTVSVYRDWPTSPVSEESRQHDNDPDFGPEGQGWDPSAFGPLKAGCEAAIQREFGERWLFLRPGVVLGPHEYVGRLEWWLRRMRRGGLVLAAGRADREIQPVDVRDLRALALDLVERGTIGVYNVAAPAGRETFGGMLDACWDAVGGDAEVVWSTRHGWWSEASGSGPSCVCGGCLLARGRWTRSGLGNHERNGKEPFTVDPADHQPRSTPTSLHPQKSRTLLNTEPLVESVSAPKARRRQLPCPPGMGDLIEGRAQDTRPPRHVTGTIGRPAATRQGSPE